MFDQQARPLGRAQRELAQHYPASGLGVEHNAEDICRDALATTRAAIEQSRPRHPGHRSPLASPINARPRWCGIGPAAHRSTGRSSGRIGALPRSAYGCQREGAEAPVRARTGLLLYRIF